MAEPIADKEAFKQKTIALTVEQLQLHLSGIRENRVESAEAQAVINDMLPKVAAAKTVGEAIEIIHEGFGTPARDEEQRRILQGGRLAELLRPRDDGRANEIQGLRGDIIAATGNAISMTMGRDRDAYLWGFREMCNDYGKLQAKNAGASASVG